MKRNGVPWQFLEEFRGTLFSGQWPSLPELFSISCSRFSQSSCFTVYSPQRVSLNYSQALERIRAAALFLQKQGLKPGDRAAVCGLNSPEWAVAYLGILWAGGVVVPIDAALHDREVKNLIQAADARFLFIDGDRISSIDSELTAVISLTAAGSDRYIYDLDLPGEEELSVPEARDDEALAAILFTSGTTGNPKGVMLTHRNLVADCFLAQANLNIRPDDVFYALLPIHHSYSMLAVFIESFSVGAETVFGKRLVVKQILHDLKAARVTMFLGVPMLFNKLLQGIMRGIREKGPVVFGIIRGLMLFSGLIKKILHVNPGKLIFGGILKKASLDSIRICISGGGPLAPSVFKQYNQLGIDFVQGYGLTETSPIVALNPTELYKETSVGKIIPQTEVKILDPDSAGNGEIAIKGPMVMQGYYNNPEATAEVMDSDGFFRTGDVGYLDTDNYLYLTGRAKNLIVTEGGKNVYPEELEDAFQLYDEVEQILIRGFTLHADVPGERIEALIYPGSDALGNADAEAVHSRMDEIVSEVNQGLAGYQKIERVTVLDEPMEMTTTKKIRRHAVES